MWFKHQCKNYWRNIFPFFCIKPLKSGIYFTLKAHRNLNKPHFKCSTATYVYGYHPCQCRYRIYLFQICCFIRGQIFCLVMIQCQNEDKCYNFWGKSFSCNEHWFFLSSQEWLNLQRQRTFWVNNEFRENNKIVIISSKHENSFHLQAVGGPYNISKCHVLEHMRYWIRPVYQHYS